MQPCEAALVCLGVTTITEFPLFLLNAMFVFFTSIRKKNKPPLVPPRPSSIYPSSGDSSSTSDPLQSVLQTLERQHEEEKRCALERQRQMYEQELQQLRRRLTPEKPSHLLDPTGLLPGSAAAVTSPTTQKRMRRWSEDR